MEYSDDRTPKHVQVPCHYAGCTTLTTGGSKCRKHACFELELFP